MICMRWNRFFVFKFKKNWDYFRLVFSQFFSYLMIWQLNICFNFMIWLLLRKIQF